MAHLWTSLRLAHEMLGKPSVFHIAHERLLLLLGHRSDD